MSQYNCYVLHKLLLSGFYLLIFCMVVETISVICLHHSYQHNAPDLTLIYVNICNISGSPARSYCGATYNTSLCVVTKAILTF